MAGALTQATNFLSSVAGSETRKTFTLTINGQLNGSRITKNSVKVAFNTVNAPALIIKKKSGLRVSNAFDIALKPEVDFHSRIACEIYFRQAKPTRLAPKAMLERFTKEAYISFAHSRTWALLLGHDTLGTEDVLMGLIAEPSGIGAKVFNAMGITLEDARIAVEIAEMINGRRITYTNNSDWVSYSPRVYELIYEKAKSLACLSIGPEHLLLALISEGEGVAAEVLEKLNVDTSKIRQEVIRIVGENRTIEAVGVGGGSGQSKMPTTSKYYWDNLTKLAEEDELDPVIGREIEVQRVIEILDRHTKNNPWLIGEPGVGKSAIVEGLALMIADNEVPETLVGKKVIRLDMSPPVASAESCREFEESVKNLMEEIRQSNNIILFIDELQTSIGTGAATRTIAAKNILKLALARGELQCIVATTLDEYKKHIENDPALERRFQTVNVPEPSVEEAIEILRGIRLTNKGEDLRDKVTDNALVAAVELSNQYINDHVLPTKAINLIEAASEWVHIRFGRLQHEARGFQKEKRLREKNEASCSVWFGKASIHIRDLDLLTAMISKCKEMSKALEKGGFTVTVADIADVVSKWTGIPVEKVIGEEKEAVDADGGEGSGESKMPNLEEYVKDLINIIAKEEIAGPDIYWKY